MRRARRSRRRGITAVLAPVAYGLLAFGAVYPWTYIPLLCGIAAIGVYGWQSADGDERQPARSLIAPLLIIAAIAALQLIPLPAPLLERCLPAFAALLRRSDFPYAIASDLGLQPWHPLSIAPESTAGGLVILAALSVFVVGCTSLLPRVRTGRLVRCLAALGAAAAVFGIVQRATFNGRIYWVWQPINVANNAFGPFVNRNHFAGWMVMVAPLTAGYLIGLIATNRDLARMSWRHRAAWLSTAAASRVILIGAAVLLMVLATVWTLSRSGIAAMAAGGAVLALHATSARRGRGGVLAASFLLVALLTGISWKGAEHVAAWYGETNTLTWRVALWSDTVPIVRDFWLSGTGFNTYGASTLLYPMSNGSTSHAMEAHNDYLQILSEGGILLTMAALAALGVLARGISRAFAEPQPVVTYWMRCGAVAGLLAIAVQEAVDFSLQIPGNAVLFAVVVAIALHRAPGPLPLSAAAPSRHAPA